MVLVKHVQWHRCFHVTTKIFFLKAAQTRPIPPPLLKHPSYKYWAKINKTIFTIFKAFCYFLCKWQRYLITTRLLLSLLNIFRAACSPAYQRRNTLMHRRIINEFVLTLWMIWISKPSTKAPPSLWPSTGSDKVALELFLFNPRLHQWPFITIWAAGFHFTSLRS